MLAGRNEQNVCRSEAGKAALLESSQAVADGVFGQLGDGVNVELLHELTTVSLDSLHADVELCGDVASGDAFCDQLQNFAFASCQADFVFSRGPFVFRNPSTTTPATPGLRYICPLETARTA
jgi:hypothetical protein